MNYISSSRKNKIRNEYTIYCSGTITEEGPLIYYISQDSSKNIKKTNDATATLVWQ